MSKKKPSRVLAIPDLHAPFEIDGSVDFLRDTYKKYKCNEVVCIGDEGDFCNISDWPSDPDGLSAGDELNVLRTHLKPFFKAFPRVRSCISNHTSRPYRMAYRVGMPRAFMQGYRQILEAPDGWQWARSWEIDHVKYEHGEGKSGKYAHLQAAIENRQSTVIGHIHAWAGSQFSATDRDLIFGMNVGCLLDNTAYAFAYNKTQRFKPVIGCGVVIDGQYPIFEPMNLGSKIEYVDAPKEIRDLPDNFDDLTKDELKNILDQYNISYRVKERKDKLIQEVKKVIHKKSKWKIFK